jgi:hypothetical protein
MPQELHVTTLFFSYSHRDEALRDQLEVQLSMLKRQGIIETWHDRRIGAGEALHATIDDHINHDEIILLLLSPDFIASDYCYDVEVQRALERHKTGDAIVLPVILRPCDWIPAFGFLNATPRDGKAVTTWPNVDEAFLQVAQAIRAAAERWNQRQSSTAVHPSAGARRPDRPDIGVASTASVAPLSALPTSAAAGPRSSNLRLAKTFTQRDHDQFRLDTFEYIARHFENSLAELGKRNEGYEGVFRRIDAGRFIAKIYQHGRDVARATVFLGDGGGLGSGIHYLASESMSNSGMNESLRIEADDQSLFLLPLGMSTFNHDARKPLTQEGAAEYYWAMLIAPLQGR